MTKLADLRGQVFGRLTALERGENAGKFVRWHCRCECGARVLVRAYNLKNGNSRSCGCLREDLRSLSRFKHGQSHGPKSRGSLAYHSWLSMRNRCYDQTNNRFPMYGAKGVVVCGRWREDFAEFFADLGPRPSKLHTLDRVDNDGGYWCGRCEECRANGWPANCRWATKRQQAINRVTTRWLEFRGRTQCMEDWCKELGLSPPLVCRRLRRGWPVERALTEPANPKGGNRYHKRRAA